MPKHSSFKTSKKKSLKVKVVPKERRVKPEKKLKAKKLKGSQVLCDKRAGREILFNVAASEVKNPFPPNIIGSHRRTIFVGDNGHTVVGDIEPPFNRIKRSGHMNPVQFCQLLARQYAE